MIVVNGAKLVLTVVSVRLWHLSDALAPCTAESTYLLRVVDLPDEGLPTRPMRGSRGILDAGDEGTTTSHLVARTV